MNIIELTHGDTTIEVSVADESALDGVPYEVWSLSDRYLVVLSRPLFEHLAGLESFLPNEDVWRMVGRWTITLVEDFRAANE